MSRRADGGRRKRRSCERVCSEDREAGAATVFAAFGVLALLVIAALCVQVGGAVVARHRAQASADLAALASAGVLADGGDACAAARTLAQSNGARVGSCLIEGRTVVVQAVVSLPLQGIAGIGPTAAEAVARAGWKIG